MRTPPVEKLYDGRLGLDLRPVQRELFAISPPKLASRCDPPESAGAQETYTNCFNFENICYYIY
jgi:hypothetical protein